MTTELLDIDIIRTDGGTQSRGALDNKTLTEYKDSLLAGEELPPIDVIFDGDNYWLWDGFHRIVANRQLGRTQIAAVIRQGDQGEAQWLSYAANKKHGLRRSQEDKERAVKAALRHPKATGLSDNALAVHVGVSDKTVTKYRRELEATGDITTQTVRTGADGRTINTANIGATRKEPSPDASDQIMPIVADWLRKYTDSFQRTWRDIETVATTVTTRQHGDIGAYVRQHGLRFDDITLHNAIDAAFAHLKATEAKQIEERIYRLTGWLLGKGWGIGLNSISIRNPDHSFTWPPDDPHAHLAALKKAEAIQKDRQQQTPPPAPTNNTTSENPKSTDPLTAPDPSTPSVESAEAAPPVRIPAYLAAVGCKMLEWPPASGTYKIYIPLGPGETDSLSAYGPFSDFQKAIALMDEFARGRGLLPGKTSSADKGIGTTAAAQLVWATLHGQEFSPPIISAKIAYLKSAPLDTYRSHLRPGETATDETLQAAIGKAEASLVLAAEHCRHPATVADTGRCTECGLLINGGDAPHPQPDADDREITETLDAAIRRAVCVYVGDDAKWQALAESGADYWQILDLLKACISSTGDSGGPGLYFIERRRGPIVVISKDIGGPVVQKLMSGALVAAVRKAWGISERGATPTSDAIALPTEPVAPPSAADPTDAKLAQALMLYAAIDALLKIIDDYGELTGNHDAPAAAARVLQPMLNRLEIMTAPDEPAALPAF